MRARASSRRSWASSCSGSARTRCSSAPTTRSGSRSGRSRASSTGTTPTTPTRTTRAWTPQARRRSSGSTPPSSTGSRCPRSSGCPPTSSPRRGRIPSWSRARDDRRCPRRARRRLRPRAGRADHGAAVRRLLRGGGIRRRGRPAAAADAAVRAELRLPDGGGRARRGAHGPRGGDGVGRVGGPLHGRGDQRGRGPRRGLPGGVPGRDGRGARRAAGSLPAQGARRAGGAPARVGARAGVGAARRPGRAGSGALPRAAARAGHRCVRRRARVRARRRNARARGGAAALRPHGVADGDIPGGERGRVPVPVVSPIRHRGGGGVKAARLHEYHQALKLDSVEEPKATGPFDVVVKIGAAGLCRTDLHIQEGQWAEKSEVVLPYTPGHENAGWVHEVGSGVSNVEVGDTVIVHPFISCGLCRPCRRGDDMHCLEGSFPGINRDGGFAELLLTSARSVVKLDPSLEPVSIAALADAGLTAIHAVKKAIPVLGAGTKAVVIGAGGLGHIGIQCLKAYTPTQIIVVDPNEKALELAEELGADHTVKAESGKHIEAVQELTGGTGAEAIIDFVGEKGAVEDGVAMIQDGGFYYVIGYGQNIDIPTIDVISREISFIGNLVGTYVDLQDLMTLTAQGKVTLHTSTYPLDAINDAMADLDNGRLQGRGILIPTGAAALEVEHSRSRTWPS